MSNAVALDASAILAFIMQEEGGAAVGGHLQGGLICAVNLAEVFSKSRDKGVSLEALKWMVDRLGINVIPFDEELAFITGALREATRSAGLSLGDRACLALGVLRKIPVLTTEKSWHSLGLDVEIVQIR